MTLLVSGPEPARAASVQRALALSATLMLAGCLPFWSFVHAERLDGPYRLVAVDTMEQMVICRSSPDGGGDCIGDGLPSETVFAAGANQRYLVAARHAPDDPFRRAEFYYVIRTPDEAERGVPRSNVVGPLTELEFDRARARLGLPEFSRTFDELR